MSTSLLLEAFLAFCAAAMGLSLLRLSRPSRALR